MTTEDPLERMEAATQDITNAMGAARDKLADAIQIAHLMKELLTRSRQQVTHLKFEVVQLRQALQEKG